MHMQIITLHNLFRKLRFFLGGGSSVSESRTIQIAPGGKIGTCVLFRTVSEIELLHCTAPKLLIRKIYYALFLMPVLIAQVTKLVQLT
jgi:hypothetical protein